jgi:hypothetical protein
MKVINIYDHSKPHPHTRSWWDKHLLFMLFFFFFFFSSIGFFFSAGDERGGKAMVVSFVLCQGVVG